MNMWLEKIPLLYNINYKENLINNCDVFDDESEVFKSLNFLKMIYDYGYCERYQKLYWRGW